MFYNKLNQSKFYLIILNPMLFNCSFDLRLQRSHKLIARPHYWLLFDLNFVVFYWLFLWVLVFLIIVTWSNLNFQDANTPIIERSLPPSSNFHLHSPVSQIVLQLIFPIGLNRTNASASLTKIDWWHLFAAVYSHIIIIWKYWPIIIIRPDLFTIEMSAALVRRLVACGFEDYWRPRTVGIVPDPFLSCNFISSFWG